MPAESGRIAAGKLWLFMTSSILSDLLVAGGSELVSQPMPPCPFQLPPIEDGPAVSRISSPQS
jgi:hypothetical protein